MDWTRGCILNALCYVYCMFDLPSRHWFLGYLILDFLIANLMSNLICNWSPDEIHSSFIIIIASVFENMQQRIFDHHGIKHDFHDYDKMLSQKEEVVHCDLI